MDSDTKEFIETLNNRDRKTRLDALRRLAEARRRNSPSEPPWSEEVNNHVHTRYSFSPYSPAAAAYHAREAGLQVVGSVDHESIGAAGEMKAAAALLDMGATVGCEVRADFTDTAFADRRLNNPDTVGNAYMVIHAVPEASVEPLAQWLEPINAAREARNRIQVEKLNEITAAELGTLDYDRDVRPLSWADTGGSVTERHILYALALRVLAAVSRPDQIGIFLSERLGLTVPELIVQRIHDQTNPHRVYDLLGAFKSGFVPRFFQQPGPVECPPVGEVTSFARKIGAIPAYAYLGDVGQSPTGDKKAQFFEDAFVDELFAALPAIGYQAVTYMPPRNSKAQLKRVQKLAAAHGLLEISGVDINSSRQSFRCPEVLQPEFRHLIESTWALVGHEAATADDISQGLFGTGEDTTAGGTLPERLAAFAELGRRSVERQRSDS